jgi:hypothetical protein
LPFEPDTVVITGRLVRRTFFGPPTFGEDPTHDTRERGYYVNVVAPICAVGAHAPQSNAPVRGVRSVQLVLDSAGYAALRPQLGHTLAVRGTLFAAETGHHHTPVLLHVLLPERGSSIR